ncbi:hypothetical protein [Burkholderia sp. TSV86]|uniref:hypothetical protein n=1 Tax=Burkholderia sp. TSV86 TaxID=1385594 RepID=UPI000752E0C8|nr:hypothetical protein [Burkholderia sp. TSV86]KVE33097.1 hypothetical protein WS68_13695 [Burkholderia sp. TSV86]
MKPTKNVPDLAASLMATAPAPLDPKATASLKAAHAAPLVQQPPAAPKVAVDRVPMSLRPPRDLHARCVAAAAKRSLEVGRVVTAQDIIIEILEKELS